MTYGRALIAIFCGLAFFVGPAAAQEVPNWPAPLIWNGAEEISDSVAKLGIHTSPLPFVGTNPCRIADTRAAGFPVAYGPPPLAAGVPRNFPLAGQCGIPPSAGAMSLNITVTNTLGPGFILIYPEGGAQPVVSTLNYIAGQTVANAAIVPLGMGGGVTVIAGVSGTDLIIDTNGYYGGSVQARVTGSCASGSSIRIVNADGTVTCETDDGSTYSAGAGLNLGSGVFSLNTSFTDGLYWKLSGNSGTGGTAGLGTTDNQPFELRTNGARVIRLEPHATSPNVMEGFSGNFAASGVFGATVGGGGAAMNVNSIHDNFGVIGGGLNNLVGDVGGANNDQIYSVIAGGLGNRALGTGSTVGGGVSNIADGDYSTVPGGHLNLAEASYTFAAGRRAKAIHQGAFVWADSSDFDFNSAFMNTFRVRATGGVRFFTAVDVSGNPTAGVVMFPGDTAWSPGSDRTLKENFSPVDHREVLERLAGLSIQTWNLVTQDPSVRHIGPMAQDFRAAFGFGSDERHISTLDADGVALAAIQGLYEQVQARDTEIAQLKARLSVVEQALDGKRTDTGVEK